MAPSSGPEPLATVSHIDLTSVREIVALLSLTTRLQHLREQPLLFALCCEPRPADVEFWRGTKGSRSRTLPFVIANLRYDLLSRVPRCLSSCSDSVLASLTASLLFRQLTIHLDLCARPVCQATSACLSRFISNTKPMGKSAIIHLVMFMYRGCKNKHT